MKKTKDKKRHFVYIVCCSDGTYYTGYTPDLKKRLKAHNEGKGARYTRGRGPVRLVWFEESRDLNEALKREYDIKEMTRKEKEELVSG